MITWVDTGELGRAGASPAASDPVISNTQLVHIHLSSQSASVVWICDFDSCCCLDSSDPVLLFMWFSLPRPCSPNLPSTFCLLRQLNSNNPWTQPSPAQPRLPLPWTPASAQLSSAQLGSIPHAAHSSSNPTPFYFDNKQIVCINSQSQHVWKKSRSCPKHPCGRN